MAALAVVEQWLDAVERADGPRLEQLTAPDVEVVGPRGTARGRDVLVPWLARAGFSARALRWWCGEGGRVVVEQDATWTDVATGAPQGAAVVASRFVVQDGQVAAYERHDALAQALLAAGLAAGDEVLVRR